MMKVLHLSFSCSSGAGNAAQRLHTALNKCDIESEFIYFKPYSRKTARIGWVEKKLNGAANILINRFMASESLNIFPTSLLRVVNRCDADVVHLHWIHGEMLSIPQIARIQKPLVWTFHDMWPVCGSEHYVENRQYIDGYKTNGGDASRPRIHSRVRRWTWRRKTKAFKNLKCQVVTPSNWMTNCAKQSMLFRNHSCRTIFNCLDLAVFKPLPNRDKLRQKYEFPLNKKIILFGAWKLDDLRKGGDLFEQALGRLSEKDDFVLAVFGKNDTRKIAGIETIWLGRIDGDEAMAEVCNCADVVCVPSRQETFGQTASEPQACGVPVVAFNATGLMDVVEHKKTGYLAEPFDPEDFCKGIEWVLHADAEELSRNAYQRAARLFDGNINAKQMLGIYEEAIESHGV